MATRPRFIQRPWGGPQTRTHPLTDRDTETHFLEWLNGHVHPDDQEVLAAKVWDLLSDHPDLIEKGRTWSEIRELVERTDMDGGRDGSR